MSGPTPLTLGPYPFQALGFSYKDLKRKLKTPWSSLEVAGRMEARHWTGPKSDTVTISGVLFPDEWGGQSTLEGVREAAKAGLVLPLITGDGDVLGLFEIEGVDEHWEYATATGQPRKNAYSIELHVIDDFGGLGGLIAGAIGSLF